MSYNVPKAVADQITSDSATAAEPKTDYVLRVGQSPVDKLGTWTPGNPTGSYFATTRTPSASSGYLNYVVPLLARSTVGTGAKPTAVRVKYTVTGTDAADITVTALRSRLNAHNVAPVFTEVASDADGYYDVDHQSAANRGATNAGAIKYHTMTKTLSSPSYLQDDDAMVISFVVTPDGPGATQVALLGVEVIYTANYNA